MKDIAAEMGVSLMTVSKALRNKSDIGEETRRRIVVRARELKYQPNLIARSLVSRRSYLIGLIIPDMMTSCFAEVAKGVGAGLEPHGYQIVVCNSGERLETELQQLKMLLSRHVDGLIIGHHPASSPADVLGTANARWVLIDRAIPGVNANFVGVNDEEIASLAVEHLIEQGCCGLAS